ncbi:MAG: hypothetical protein PHX60_01975 [Giesbergeria sp.]|uniref:hypothetical protein n=1 Tax=Giesbergeria sp. TaxID=2818473 RepID=UPI002606555C|nr:hypothetical protein [Giesbergeria sp.]MDD2608448.1 hypothetical protein [Giesbergeria sp.]
MAIFRQQPHRPAWPCLGAAPSRALWWLCALLLVLAPSLGQIHRVLHSGQAAHPPLALHDTISAHPDHPASGLHQLFSSHRPTDPNCLLLDEGSWATPEVALQPLPPLAPATLRPAGPYSHPAATRLAAFQARAPPDKSLG